MALMPDITALLVDPGLGAQRFTVSRRTGRWREGRFVPETEELIQATGNIQPATAEALQFFPEGERRRGAIVIRSKTLLHLTEGADIADTVTWRGEQYKIVRVDRWDDYGFCVGYAHRRDAGGQKGT